MKVVADAQTKQILGAAILGVGGDEAIHGILDMMNAGATYPVLQWAVPIQHSITSSTRRAGGGGMVEQLLRHTAPAQSGSATAAGQTTLKRSKTD
jgi:hypothetical protein